MDLIFQIGRDEQFAIGRCVEGLLVDIIVERSTVGFSERGQRARRDQIGRESEIRDEIVLVKETCPMFQHRIESVQMTCACEHEREEGELYSRVDLLVIKQTVSEFMWFNVKMSTTEACGGSRWEMLISMMGQVIV